MPKFLIENLTDRTVKLAIEPWADSEVLAPGAKLDFDYDDPSEIVQFSLLRDGNASVGVWSDHITVSGNGVKRTFTAPQS